MAGHIRRSGKASWELKFNVEGKTVYRSFKGTKREAIAEMTRLTASAIDGTYVDGNKLTVAEFLDRWLRDWTEVHNSPKTRQNNAQLIHRYVAPHIGAVPLQKLKPLHLAELHARLLQHGASDGGKLSPTTVANAHRVLKNAFRHAIRWGLLVKSPAADISPPRNDLDEIEIHSEAETKALLDRLHGTSLYIVAVLGLATGMRRGEMCALRWGDVDLASGVIKVERSLEQSKIGGMRIKPPKSRAGRRAITIPAAVVEELRKHRLTMQEHWLAIGLGKLTDDTTVLATAFGEMRSADSLSRDWCALKAGTLHSLRHFHASQLIAAGVDVVAVSKRLGHSNPSVTLRIYAHLYAPKDDQAAKIVGQSFLRML